MTNNNNNNDTHETEPSPDDEDEDCLLCLEPLQACDKEIPMLCPLDGCPFNYCSQCVWNLLLTSSQPYQEASDGSKQLKVALQCPQCRTKYPHRQIVQDVLLLRQAHRLEPLFFTPSQNESSLKASDLSAKADFGHQVTYEGLRESWLRVDKYLRGRFSEREGFEVDTITDEDNRIPPLPEQWKDHLSLHNHNTSSSRNGGIGSSSSFDSTSNQSNNSQTNTSRGIGQGQAQYDIVDPTLFQGMDETMTLSEQEFLSKLLISGSVPNLMHAAQVLYGMLQLMLQGGLKARSSQPLSGVNYSSLSGNDSNNSHKHYSTTPHNSNNNLRMLTTGTRLLYPDMDTALLRKRFPLPLHMPRWIVLPVYNPHKRGAPLSFQDDPYGLLVTSVKGSAGQQGIRKGDIVTHINEDACASSTPDDFTVYMKTLYDRFKHSQDSMEGTVTLVVNAHPDTAQALQKRSFDMIHFLTTTNTTQPPKG